MNTTVDSSRLAAHLAPAPAPASTAARSSAPAGAAAPHHGYDPSSTLRQARACYFADNDFGADGGYGDRWVEVKVGPFPYAIPNTEGRVRAVRYHDLHHIMTGYRTDWMGECEISGWELGSGCRDFHAAWFLNLSGMALGLVLSPRRMYRAFVRGRHSRNLYGRTFDDVLLDARVGAMRAELGLDQAPPPATTADKLAFAAFAAVGVVLDVTQIALLFVPFTILGAVLLALRSNRGAGAAKM